ncbi:MAG: alpha-galactosidase, partial [Treponemataceae bacterium]|nr:alpha-galactosidase [Treponemataceae bacterium]
SDDYFQAKDKLKKLFDLGQFEDLKFLSGKFPQEPILGWESWYNHYTKIDEKIISQDIKSLKDTKNLINFLADKEDAKSSPVIFQIDDGWESMVGDWSIHSEKFSKGLKPLVQEIEKSSFIPGLWIAPFLIYQQCPIAQAHPDWLLKDEKGNLVPAGVNPGWNGLKNFFTFDLSNDQVLEYLDSIMEKAINEWGFRYLKLDFMYAGMLYGKFQKGGAAFQHYNKAISILTRRKENNKGQRLAYLGCGIPMEQSYKNFPLSRIGCDTYEHWINPLMRAIRWNGRNEAYLNLKDSLGRSLWDKTIYFNDPDVIFIRNENCRLTQDEKILIASVNSMFGSQVMYSDDPEKSSSEDQVELARKISDLIKKYQDKEFSVKPLSSDIYQVQSRDGKIKAKIELGKNHKITLE